MFRLTKEETDCLRFQTETSNKGRGGRRYRPYVFTQEGIAMLSSVLKSSQAIQVNIVIVRAFVKLRQVLASHKELADRLSELEQRMGKKDQEIIALFEAIRRLMKEEEKPKTPMGFQPTH